MSSAEFITIHDTRTAIFSMGDATQPTTLLIHGINGSHYGFAELADRLTQAGYHVVLVDLPGHGDSDMPSWSDLANLRQWCDELLGAVASRFGALDKIVAHSFGCYVLGGGGLNWETTFICPVPTVSRYYRVTAKLGRLLALPLAPAIYNWTPFSAWRGFMLLKAKNWQNWHRQYAVARADSGISAAKRRYQVRLARISEMPHIFASVHPTKVIMGSRDRLPQERSPTQMQQVFPDATIAVVDGGHLLTTESPDQVCAKIVA